VAPTEWNWDTVEPRPWAYVREEEEEEPQYTVTYQDHGNNIFGDRNDRE